MKEAKEDLLFAIGGDAPGGIPFVLEEVWDISKDQFWGTVLLEIYTPDERHGKYWPQTAIRMVWQELFRVPGKRHRIRARVARAEFKQGGQALDLSEEAVWVSQLDSTKLVRALHVLEERLRARRLAWQPTQAEIASFQAQDAALEGVCTHFRALSGPDEIREVPEVPKDESLLEENTRLRQQLAVLEARHSRLVEAVLGVS